MHDITVSSLPIHQVIQDIARGFNVKFQENYNFYRVELPADVGDGHISGIDFGGGFGMLNYNCTFHDTVTIRFTLKEIHPMKFIHCREGKFTHTFEWDNDSHDINTYENIIVASSQHNGHILRFVKGHKIEICSIEVDRNLFLPNVEKLNMQEDDVLSKVILDIGGKNKFFHRGHYSLVIHNIITSLLEGKETEIADIFFKKGKSYEMLAMQWDQFYLDNSKLALNRKINLGDFTLLENIINHVEDNLDEAITLKTIEEKFHTNEKRVQFIFKSGYQTTFNAYLQNFRLEKAIKLLKDPSNNITDVVYAVGLTNKSYFSKIFKEKFGVTPSQFLKEVSGQI